MRTFTCLTMDRRSSVPKLTFQDAEDERGVREIARDLVGADPNYSAVEVWESDRLLFVEHAAGGA